MKIICCEKIISLDFCFALSFSFYLFLKKYIPERCFEALKNNIESMYIISVLVIKACMTDMCFRRIESVIFQKQTNLDAG